MRREIDEARTNEYRAARAGDELAHLLEASMSLSGLGGTELDVNSHDLLYVVDV